MKKRKCVRAYAPKCPQNTVHVLSLPEEPPALSGGSKDIKMRRVEVMCRSQRGGTGPPCIYEKVDHLPWLLGYVFQEIRVGNVDMTDDEQLEENCSVPGLHMN